MLTPHASSTSRSEPCVPVRTGPRSSLANHRRVRTALDPRFSRARTLRVASSTRRNDFAFSVVMPVVWIPAPIDGRDRRVSAFRRVHQSTIPHRDR